MAHPNPGNLGWLDKLAALMAEKEKTPNASHEELAKAIDVDRSWVSILLALKPILDPPTVAKIHQAAKAEPSFTLSFKSAKLLTALKSKGAEYPKAGREALDQILAQRMGPSQIQAQVAKMAGGTPPKKAGLSVKTPCEGTPALFERLGGRVGGAAGRVLDSLLGLSSWRKTRPQAPQTGLPPEAPKAREEEVEAAQAESPEAGSKAGQGRKAGRSLPWGLAAKPFKWAGKQIEKIIARFLDHPGTFMRNLTVGTVKFVWWSILFCLLLIVFHWGWAHFGRAFYGDHVAWRLKSLLGLSAPKNENTQAMVPMPQAAPSPPTVKKPSRLKTPNHALSMSKGSKLLTSNSGVSTPNSSLQTPNYLPSHPWTVADEALASLEDELSALPDEPILIKDFPVELDTTMGSDLAGTRLEDLTDHDRYSVRIGRDKKDIQGVVPGSSTLVLGFSKGILGNLADPVLGSGGNNGIKIIWEDIQTIHCNEMDPMSDHPGRVYQCALLVPGKAPVIVQCGSAVDMEHFISAIEFWIRSARHGQAAPIGGFPYINQGIALKGEGVVKKLWANSCLYTEGLKPGDHAWSLDKNTNSQTSNDGLEKGLQSLGSGKHVLFAVTAEDWAKAQDTKIQKYKMSNSNISVEVPVAFNPMRRQMDLIVP
jgi:hypothetical protein